MARDEQVLAYAEEFTANSAAGWLHPAIQSLFQQTNTSLSDVDAVGVSIGPGSYTGLRIGLAAAKGLGYALNKPLIGIGTLHMMAAAALAQIKDLPAGALLCPMIDARRMEVFTALYNQQLDEITAPTAIIIDEKSFEKELTKSPIIFFGNGSNKCAPIIKHPQAVFQNVIANAQHLVPVAVESFRQQQFLSLAYSEPFYGKAFYSPSPKEKRF